MCKRQYSIYIMTDRGHTVPYTGVTNDLRRRVLEHRLGRGGAFTRRYNVTKLVYFEWGDDSRAALARVKQIKGGSRCKKIELIGPSTLSGMTYSRNSSSGGHSGRSARPGAGATEATPLHGTASAGSRDCCVDPTAPRDGGR